MKTCHSCDFFRKANEEGGLCYVEPPKIFLIPVEQAPKMDQTGKVLVPGQTLMVPATYRPACRLTDGCSWHEPKTSDEERMVAPLRKGN